MYCDYNKNNKYEKFEKLPQDATNEYYSSNRDRISKEREKYHKRLEYREKIQFYFFILCIPIAIILLIVSIFSGSKKSN